MNKVYVLTHSYHYDGSIVVSVHKTDKGAKKALEKYIKEQRKNYEENIKYWENEYLNNNILKDKMKEDVVPTWDSFMEFQSVDIINYDLED